MIHTPGGLAGLHGLLGTSAHLQYSTVVDNVDTSRLFEPVTVPTITTLQVTFHINIMAA